MSIDNPTLSIQLSANDRRLDTIKTGMNTQILKLLKWSEQLFFKNSYYDRFLFNMRVEKLNNKLWIEINKLKKDALDYRESSRGTEDCIRFYFVREEKTDPSEIDSFRLNEILFSTYRTDFKVDINHQLNICKKISILLSFVSLEGLKDYPVFNNFFRIESSESFSKYTSKFEFYCVAVRFDCQTQKIEYDIFFSHEDREYSLISEIKRNQLTHLLKDCNHYPKTVEDICDIKAIHLLEMLIA